MTGPEHYREAERLIVPGEYDGDEPEAAAHDFARAQVHALLALAAATATMSMHGSVTVDTDVEWLKLLGGIGGAP